MAVMLGAAVSAMAPQVVSAETAAPGMTQARMSTIKGSISGLDLRSSAPIVKVTDAQGQERSISVDPQATAVLKDGQQAKLDALKVGQQVEVSPVMKEGRQLAQTITVTTAAPAGAATRQAQPNAPAEPRR
ncbi:MAG: hypothetical protein HYY15_01745 [Candidatus Omnitrophica bacterium]|nr:hypothetical protein [Candidatus Omnitrophota bacterium]